ncbi:hypothetical protein I7I48_04627 [Histoplasma ohiense]|nr:hypothetical protein I7I48_04627 [Histoplasma ohiense (nom. inval.)]
MSFPTTLCTTCPSAEKPICSVLDHSSFVFSPYNLPRRERLLRAFGAKNEFCSSSGEIVGGLPILFPGSCIAILWVDYVGYLCCISWGSKLVKNGDAREPSWRMVWWRDCSLKYLRRLPTNFPYPSATCSRFGLFC